MGRKVEEIMLYFIIKYAKTIGLKEIHAKYLQTPKNKPVLNFFLRSGLNNIDKKVNNYLKELFKEYQSLREKTKMTVNDLKPSKKYNTNYINAADVLKRKEIGDKLKDNMDFLSDEQTKELRQDDDMDMASKAIHTRVKRKLKK